MKYTKNQNPSPAPDPNDPQATMHPSYSQLVVYSRSPQKPLSWLQHQKLHGPAFRRYSSLEEVISYQAYRKNGLRWLPFGEPLKEDATMEDIATLFQRAQSEITRTGSPCPYPSWKSHFTARIIKTEIRSCVCLSNEPRNTINMLYDRMLDLWADLMAASKPRAATLWERIKNVFKPSK